MIHGLILLLKTNFVFGFASEFTITTPHAHAYGEYRACDHAHVLRRDARAHANGLHPRLHHHVCAMDHRVCGCARGIKPYAHANVRVVR